MGDAALGACWKSNGRAKKERECVVKATLGKLINNFLILNTCELAAVFVFLFDILATYFFTCFNYLCPEVEH